MAYVGKDGEKLHILHIMRCSQCTGYYKAIGKANVRVYQYRCPHCDAMYGNELELNSDRGVCIAVATDVPWCTSYGDEHKAMRVPG